MDTWKKSYTSKNYRHKICRKSVNYRKNKCEDYKNWEKKEGTPDTDTENIFHKIIEENCYNLKKEVLIKLWEACRTPNRPD